MASEIYSRLRAEFPFQARMMVDHPDDPRFLSGHWFCFARPAGAHLQVLHQSSRTRVLIPRPYLEEIEPFEAAESAAAPATSSTPPDSRLADWLKVHGGARA